MTKFYKNCRYFVEPEPEPEPFHWLQLRLQLKSPAPASSGSTTLWRSWCTCRKESLIWELIQHNSLYARTVVIKLHLLMCKSLHILYSIITVELQYCYIKNKNKYKLKFAHWCIDIPALDTLVNGPSYLTLIHAAKGHKRLSCFEK